MVVQSIYKILFTFIFSILIFNSAYAKNLDKVYSNFLIFIEKEFLSKNIKTKSIANSNKFVILDVNQDEYLVSFNLIRKNFNQDIVFIPTLKIISQSDNISFSLSRSLTFELDSNLFEIESITKMLVNSSIIQMKKNGLQFTLGDQKYKDQNEKKLMVRINYFNSCERNKIIEIMEKEFPGFIHLEADNMSTPSTTSILYYTNSTIYKIKKWLTLVLNEFNFSANDFFIKSYQSKIDVTKVNKLKYIYVCE